MALLQEQPPDCDLSCLPLKPSSTSRHHECLQASHLVQARALARAVRQRVEAGLRLVEALAGAEGALSPQAWEVGAAARHCLASVEAEERRCWALEAEEERRFLALGEGAERICLAWEEAEELRMLGAMVAEEELRPRAVVERVETLKEAKGVVRRGRVAEGEALDLASSVGEAEAQMGCLALGAVEERALCWVVGVVLQRARDCQQMAEAHQTSCHSASRRRLRVSSVVVAGVVALDS